jgi:GT2 family glycosyltransferase
MMMPRISVVIPTYRRRASAMRALRALERQTLPPQAYEVILSVDGSTDGTREAAEAFAPAYPLKVLWQPNRGRAAACNAGIGEARGDLVVLLDDDMEPAPGHLAAHERAHATGSRLAVMGAVPIPVGPSSPPVVRYIGSKFNRHLEKLARPDHHFRLRNFYSGNLSIRREILREVGGFDEAFQVYGNEDLELWVRLESAGVTLAFDPEALAHQHYEKDLAGLARDNLDKGRTAVLLARKHPAVLGDLKLGSYERLSLKRRLPIEVLLRLTRVYGGTPGALLRLVAWLGEHRPDGVGRLYALALDYFFWLGASEAKRSHAASGGAAGLAPRVSLSGGEAQ